MRGRLGSGRLGPPGFAARYQKARPRRKPSEARCQAVQGRPASWRVAVVELWGALGSTRSRLKTKNASYREDTHFFFPAPGRLPRRLKERTDFSGRMRAIVVHGTPRPTSIGERGSGVRQACDFLKRARILLLIPCVGVVLTSSRARTPAEEAAAHSSEEAAAGSMNGFQPSRRDFESAVRSGALAGRLTSKQTLPQEKKKRTDRHAELLDAEGDAMESECHRRFGAGGI